MGDTRQRVTALTPPRARDDGSAIGIDDDRLVLRFVLGFALTLAIQLAEIQDALGTDAAGVLPPLLALRSVTLRLPEYIVRAFEVIAADGGTTVDAALGLELTEFAGQHLARLEGAIPGYREAYMFPSPPVRAN